MQPAHSLSLLSHTRRVRTISVTFSFRVQFPLKKILRRAFKCSWSQRKPQETEEWGSEPGKGRQPVMFVYKQVIAVDYRRLILLLREPVGKMLLGILPTM